MNACRYFGDDVDWRGEIIVDEWNTKERRYDMIMLRMVRYVEGSRMEDNVNGGRELLEDVVATAVEDDDETERDLGALGECLQEGDVGSASSKSSRVRDALCSNTSCAASSSKSIVGLIQPRPTPFNRKMTKPPNVSIAARPHEIL